MKLLSPILKVQLFLLFFLFSSHVFSQDLSVNVHAESTHDSWSSGPLPLCAGTMRFKFNIFNISDQDLSGSFTLSDLSNSNVGITISEEFTSSCSEAVNIVAVNDEGDDFMMIQLSDLAENESCEFEVDFSFDDLSCDDFDEEIAQLISIGVNSSIDIAIQGDPAFEFSVNKSVLKIFNFLDENGNELSQNTEQHLSLAPNMSRYYDIECTYGVVESFQFNLTLEHELSFKGFELSGYYNEDVPTNTTIEITQGNDYFDLLDISIGVDESTIIIISETMSEVLIDELFGDGFMVDENFIRIKEIFDVVECTQTAVEWMSCAPVDNDDSKFDIGVVCQSLGDNTCWWEELYSRAVRVHSAYTGLPYNFTVTPGGIDQWGDAISSCSQLSLNEGEACPVEVLNQELDICGVQTSNLVFSYRNVVPNGEITDSPECSDVCGNIPWATGNGAVGSGMKRINYVQFPLNVSWFEGNPNEWEVYLVDLNDPGSELLINNNPDLDEDVLIIDEAPLSNRCILDIELLAQIVHQSPTIDDVPAFEDLYLIDADGDTGPERDLAEGGRFAIEFRNLRFVCNEGGFYAAGDAFDLVEGFNPDPEGGWDCEISHGYYSPINNNLYSFRARYLNMNMIPYEEDLGEDVLCYNQHGSTFHNSLGMESFATADPTDVVEIDSPETSLEFIYTSQTTNSPFDFGTVLNCYDEDENVDMTEYYLELIVPVPFGLSTGSPIEYYQSPDDAYDEDANPIVLIVGDEEVLVDGSILYTLVPEDESDEILKTGLVRLKVFMVTGGDCPPVGFGEADVFLNVMARCGACEGCADCDGCVYKLACIGNEIFYHCVGPCCTQIATDTMGFSFNRVSMGWVEPNMEVRVESDAEGVVLNRVYPSDIIEVKLDGYVAPNSTSQVTTPDDACSYNDGAMCEIDEIFMLINYETTENFQFYDFVKGEFIIDFQTGEEPTVVDVGIDDLDGFDDCLDCELRVSLNDDDNVITAIGGSGADISFRGYFAVRDEGILDELLIQDDTDEIVYEFQQIRAQFAGQYANCSLGNEIFSCDSWGDNMTIINISSRLYDVGIKSVGNPSATTYEDLGPCALWLTFGGRVKGGMSDFDEFPNEFRPVMMWLPNQYSFDPTLFGDEFDDVNINVEDYTGLFYPEDDNIAEFTAQIPDVSSIAAESAQISVVPLNPSDQIIIFDGYEIGGEIQWPIYDEHNGFNNIEYHIKYKLPAYNSDFQSCMLGQTAFGDYTVNIPHVRRAYAIPPDPATVDYIDEDDFDFFKCLMDYTLDDCDGDGDENYGVYDELTPPILNANGLNFQDGLGEESSYTLYSSTGTITGISFTQYYPSDFAIDYSDVWLKDLSTGIEITEVRVILNEEIVNTDNDIENDGLFQLGDVLNSTYYLEIDYMINVDDCESNFELKFDYGYTCLGYDAIDPSYPECRIDEFSMQLATAGSSFGVDLSEGPSTSTGSPCDSYSFVVQINPYDDADVENPIFSLELNENFTVEWGFSFDPDTEPENMTIDWNEDDITCEEGISCVYSIDLNQDVFNGDGIPGGDQEIGVFLHFTVSGNCNMANSIQNITPLFTGENICGEQLDPLGLPDPLNLSFNDGADCEPPCDDGNYCVVLDNVGSGLTDKANDVLSLGNGSFAIAGDMYGAANDPDFGLAVLNDNPMLMEELNAQIDGTGVGIVVDQVHSALFDGNSNPNRIFLAGQTRMANSSDTDIFIACIFMDGELDWHVKYDNNRYDVAKKIIWADDQQSRILVVGESGALNYPTIKTDVFALMLQASDGIMTSKNSFAVAGVNNYEFVSDVIRLNGTDDFVIVGSSHEIADKNIEGEIFALKIDNSLASIGDFSFIGSDNNNEYNDRATAIVQHGQALYVSGFTDEPGMDRAAVLEIDLNDLGFPANGNALVMDCSGCHSRANDVITGVSDDLILAGIYNDGTGSGLVMGVDVLPGQSMTVNWASRTNNQVFDDSFEAVVLVENDNGIAVGRRGIATDDDEMFFVKFDASNGESCCLVSTHFSSGSGFRGRFEPVKENKIFWHPTKPYGSAEEKNGFSLECPVPESRNIESRHTIIDEASFSVFPNPNSGTFTVELEDPEDVLKKITLLDLAGREIIRQEFEENDKGLNAFTMSTNVLRSGVYILRVESEGDQGMSRISIMR